jgi:cytidylate kinase
MATEVTARDRMDSERTVAPLRAAEDAVVIDTDALDLDGVVAEVLRDVRQA